jgi:hypothetical protein
MPSSGSSPTPVWSHQAPNIPSIRNSPWAKLIISMRPQMIVSPTATRA